MELQLAWKILGLEPTGDIEVVKEHYHERLKDTNPEDDAEGFMRLRQAYEQISDQILHPQDTEGKVEEKPKDDIDLWLERVEQVYWYADTRNDPAAWQELLDDPLCVALDTALEVRERLLAYLMSHYYMDQKIWQLLDHVFHFQEDRQELEELFPKDWLDYVQYMITAKTFFRYELLEPKGIDESEIQLDAYIRAYLGIKTRMDQRDYSGVWQALDDLSVTEVYHPYEDVERIRLYVAEEKPEQAMELADRLYEKYAEDTYVLYTVGIAYQAGNQWEKARQCWQSILDVQPEHYGAQCCMAKYYQHQEDYLKAKEIIMDLLERNSRDEEVLQMMREVNIPLIAYYDEEEKKDREAESLPDGTPKSKKNAIEACWCMFQNEQFAETIERLQQLHVQSEEPEYYEYVNMMGRCYLGLDQYEPAVVYLLKWDEARANLVDDGSDKYKKRQSREGFIKSAIGVAYQNMKKYEPAEEYLQKGIALEQDDQIRHSFMDRLALLYYDTGNYPRCAEVCTQIVEEDPGYYPAYLRRQQAAYEMRDAQQVVDDYYNAIHIFPKYYRPYLLATEVFCNYRQYEDAKKVIEAAKAAEVQQEKLQYYEVQILRKQAQNPEESGKALQACRELLKQLQEARRKEEEAPKPEGEMTEEELVEQDMKRDGVPQDRVELEDLIFEELLNLMDMNRMSYALELIREEQKAGRGSYRLRWVEADIYRMQRDYKQAIDAYERLLQERPDNADIFYNRGLCYQSMGKEREALKDFRETLRLDPEHMRVNHQMMKIYSRWYDQYELKWTYGAALKAINAQIERDADAYYYIERGLLYMDNYNTEQAIADYERALEQEPKNIYALNNIGYVYQVKGQYQEALEYYRKSIANMEDETTALPYINGARCYQALGQYQEGIRLLKQGLEQGICKYASAYRKLADFYGLSGDYDRERSIYQEALNKKVISTFDYYEDVIDSYAVEGNQKMVKEIYTRWMQAAEQKIKVDLQEGWYQKANAKEKMGKYYLFSRKLKQAISYLEEAYKWERQHAISSLDAGRRLATAYMLAGKNEKAARLAQIIRREMIIANQIPEDLKRQEAEDPETEDAFLSYRQLAPMRLDEMAQVYICMGRFVRARKYMEQARKIPKCRNCSHGGICYDSLITEAYLAEIQGDIPSAIRCLEAAKKTNPKDEEVILGLMALCQ